MAMTDLIDDCSDDDLPVDPDAAQPAASMPAPKRAAHQGSPLALIAGLALQRVLRPADRRRLRERHSLVVILQAPTAAWCGPLARAVRAIAHETVHIVTATGERRRSGSPGDEQEAAAAIAGGNPVVGISPAPDLLLPSVLRTAADRFLAVPPASPALIAQAIATWCAGRRPKDLTPEDLAGLDLTDLAAALRPGSI
ncbi:hypothetical protein [Microvirga massiliensis]|uniref:hypothetical protein n=1 Tax=Microvirga massiliensis TaxID=1033741 RepID=UPI00062BEB07|nr:hypothetical protein [Microvirga massiliensis]